jgi:phosphatidylethanolamine/phosphatidyl-N-methylethanolamine N-methyltransferase
VNNYFFKYWLKNPGAVGAITPSSLYLARAMAQPADQFDAVIELGAGTGVITEALIERNPSARLVAFELDPTLAGQLAARHPGIDVFAGCFHERAQILDSLPERALIVSALPFRSLPMDVIRPTTAILAKFLLQSVARRLVQFTYQPRTPFDVPKGLTWRRRRIIWRNTPPAGVWELGQGEAKAA